MFTSSTREIPAPRAVPRHVAIIMDGNGRWAKQRMLPRVAGHRRGVEAVRAIILACIELDIEFLTLFAFFVSLVFAVIAKDETREQFRVGGFMFAGFLAAAVVLGWLMYPFPL